MYFLPRSNAFYSRIVYIKPLHRYAITFAANIALLSVWYFGVHGLLESQTHQAQAEITRLRQQEFMMKQSVADSTQLDASIVSLQNALKTHAASSGDTFQAAMMNIVNQAGICGLAMQSCAMTEHKEENWYTKNTVNVDVSGSFDQLLKFVQSLSNAGHLMAMHHASLTRIPVQNKFNLRCGMDVIIIK
jgi:Tfp pilus assembly protein PilO